METQTINKTDKKEKPAFKLKVGNIDIAVWSHTSHKGDYFSVSYNKNYLDEKKEWQKTTNLMISDLPNLRTGLQKAYEFAKIKN